MGMLRQEPRQKLVCDPKLGRTRQSAKAECDINNIMARFVKTGMLTYVQTRTPAKYLDVSEVQDFRTMLEQVRITENFFAGLPATVRARFENDPVAFMDFMGDPSKEEEARELGLVPKPVRGPEAAPVVAPPA